MLNYHLLMVQLGLSLSPTYFNRRRKNYPQHFAFKDGQWFVSKQLASYITECRAHEMLVLKMKIEGGSV